MSKEKRFTDTHEWVEMDQDIATVGITGFAAREIGEVVYIQYPAVGEKVSAGEDVVVLESTKAAIDISTPVSGQVVAVNSDSEKKQKRINDSPEKEGWLFRVRLSNPEEVTALMTHAEYKALVEKS